MNRWRLQKLWRDDGTQVGSAPPDLVPVVPNTATILPLEMFQRHIKLDNPNDILWLREHLPAVLASLEERLSRTLVRTRWIYYADCFPDGAIDLPKPPIISVEEVAYMSSGLWVPMEAPVTQPPLYPYDPPVVTGGGYYLAVGGLWGSCIYPVNGMWPQADQVYEQVRVIYTAGFPTPAQIPAPYQTYLAAALGTLYENRESMIGEVDLKFVPELERLLVDRPVVFG